MKSFKKIVIPVALAATLSLTAFLAACGDKKPGKTPDAWRDQSIWLSEEPLVPTGEAQFAENVEFTKPTAMAMVHDPSVFHDPVSGAYYAYGTHFAVSKTFDLDLAYADSNSGGWERVESENTFDKIFGSDYFTYSGNRWPESIRETVELVKPESSISTTWAPDVEYMGGKYYMYYSLTKAFGSPNSAIARVESDNPEGPFDNNTIIVDSMTRSNSADPNCIDPELFYDKDGGLWMVYGSASGGIYIKELYNSGKNIGLPKESGFGKLIWKAGGNAGKNEEGPFVYYNASTKYYYLMTSHAALQYTYNMHVARSLNPNGPYVGVDGKDVAGDGDGNLVAGNFLFDRGSSQGYAAMGHNSVVKDKDGKYYAIYHSRFLTSKGNSQEQIDQGHRLYVSQIYFNEDGWPVLSPTPYVGETRGTMTEDQIAGQYDIVVHAVPTGSSQASGSIYKASYVKSTTYTLAAGGAITGTGAQSGDKWELKEGYYIEITLKGVTYKGVVAPGWDVYTSTTAAQKAVVDITAVSDAGIPLWGIKK